MDLFTAKETEIVVLPEGEETLRKASKLTSFKEAHEMRLLDRLQAANSRAWTGGVGLAAVQLGIHLRVAFYKDPSTKTETPRFLINPEILHAKNCMPHTQEGCLSIPHRRFNCWRFQEIVYQKLVNGKAEQFTARGREAVIIQHEVDHMNGILCCDRTFRPEMPERNELCPCDSGKKFKKCCIEKGVPYV